MSESNVTPETPTVQAESQTEAQAVPRDDGGQAFPRAGFDGPDTACEETEGMTLRDYFAGQALAGFCAAPDERVINGGTPAEVKAKRWLWAKNDAEASYRLADAMLAARKAVQS